MQVINYGCDFNWENWARKEKEDKQINLALVLFFFFLRNTEADWWAPEVKVKQDLVHLPTWKSFKLNVLATTLAECETDIPFDTFTGD